METKETRVCSCCGKEFPATEFRRIGRKGGGYSILTICQSCMRERQKEGRKKKAEERALLEEKKETDARKLRIQDFTPRELMEELVRRGYEFEMTYTEVHKISSKTFDV